MYVEVNMRKDSVMYLYSIGLAPICHEYGMSGNIVGYWHKKLDVYFGDYNILADECFQC